MTQTKQPPANPGRFSAERRGILTATYGNWESAKAEPVAAEFPPDRRLPRLDDFGRREPTGMIGIASFDLEGRVIDSEALVDFPARQSK